MKKLLAIMVLGLLWSGNAYAETKIKYKTYNKLPCKFNGVIVASPANPNTGVPPKRGRCSNSKGYKGKMGSSIEGKVGTPIVAIKDMRLIFAYDYSSENRCLWDNVVSFKGMKKNKKLRTLIHPETGEKMKCDYPWDGVSLTFKVKNSEALIRYYHLKDTTLVPGFKIGKCKPRKFYKIKGNSSRAKTVYAKDCGGIKKEFVKKGEVIGTMGFAGNAHISLGINPDGRGFVHAPEDKFKWENLPTDSDAYLFPVMSKKYLKEIGYYD